MLQVKNLVKRYSTKGETLTALDHVSVNFPEKGMVFLLGKSGSGKSTLLNISGGLDTPDEGEVIVKGKSSKDFTASDFDSYRNTYVGFIFQEYNILSELTVAENVALALELQGKPRDEQYVNELLERVDLADYGNRRPNTLSGGQKQRVAIARALVKNPEIIMADEPTGALDSDTGKQVFDTLKKLSKEKLVVVVSHDRDFAESYADRIIELKDGKIISDVTRGAAQEGARNLSELSEHKLAVNCGVALSKEEETRILAFLRRHKGGVVISSEADDVNGAVENSGYTGFGKTVQEEAVQEEESCEFIKSSFPAHYAFKMGMSGLKLKPVRLIFTTLLATIAFIVFGVFSTLITYDTVALGSNTLNDSLYGAAVLTKYGVLHMQNGDTEYTNKLYTANGTLSHFSDSEVEEFLSKYPEMNFIPAYTFNVTSRTYCSILNHVDYSSAASNDYFEQMKSFTAFADVSYISDYLAAEENGVIDLVAGRAPQNAGECLISYTAYELFAHFGYLTTSTGGDVIPLSKPDELVGREIGVSCGAIGQIYLTICGVIDTHDDFSSYDFLKKGRSNSGMTSEEYLEAQNQLNEYYTYSLASLCFVGDGFYDLYAEKDQELATDLINQRIRSGATQSQYFNYSNYLQRNVYEMDNGRTFVSYDLNPDAEAKGSYVSYLFASLKESASYKCKTLMKFDSVENAETDVGYWTPYAFMSDIRESEDTFARIFAIMGAAAAVLAVFAALLLFNFISASINAKKKDIGILRAVGARGIDVFKIFIVEGVAITLFCFVLGCLGSLAACAVTNSVLIANAVMNFKMFSFGWANWLIVLAIALVTAFVATVIPVSVTARKKPVETIRSI